MMQPLAGFFVRGLRLVAATLMLALLAAPSLADEATDRATIDTLFAQLRDAPDAETAHQIDQRIWTLWTTPSDAALHSRMREALASRNMGNLMGALQLLDELVADYPDFPEGWNQRATIYYMIGDYERSLADCGRVLELEPRHFGALSGRALIYLAQGKRALALKDMAAALAIHPFLTERRLFPELDRDITQI